MQQYFDRLSMFVDEPELPQRIRFMIQDVIELRRDNWVSRKAVVPEGPLPLREVSIRFCFLLKLLGFEHPIFTVIQAENKLIIKETAKKTDRWAANETARQTSWQKDSQIERLRESKTEPAI